MVMNKILKATTFLITVFILVMQISLVYAVTDINPNEYNPTKYRNDSGEEVVLKRVKIITRVIRDIGIVVCVGALMIIGIKMMTASVEEKSILLQALPGYILGMIMVFAITVIPSLIYESVKGIQK